MNHSRVRARMNDFLERDLSPEERSRIAGHLAECPECSRELHELENTVTLLRRLPAPEVPPRLAESVMARVRAGEAEPGTVLRWIQRLGEPVVAVPLAAGLASLVLFAGLQGGILPRPGAEPQPVARVAADQAPAPEVAGSPMRAAASRRLDPGAAFQGGDSPEARAALAATQLRLLREIQLRWLALQLAQRGPSGEVARILRSAGHPHSASLASQLEERDYPSVVLADWSAR